ncbi:hypothetical protein [Sphingomicrobium astaxanthinifaciens]|uniref:hypothetical protein n=1 Tax=Sphingomicrobium astaxanthinifaciens TaxID=1227949 RepID=UPI001FCB9DEE|nr:hypothetical protein [Sphingomicrobium astaxanthinifaciens]MCJ7421824.1 hypothetical protein [Sphingomicrobium astaxanthinifaciens]
MGPMIAALLLQMGTPGAPPPERTAEPGAEAAATPVVIRREVRRSRGPDGVVEEQVIEKEITKEVEGGPGDAPGDALRGEPACATRAFAAAVESVGEDGARRAHRVVLCASDDSAATYRTMLESARERLARTEQLSAASRVALLEQIEAELATLPPAGADREAEPAPDRSAAPPTR